MITARIVGVAAIVVLAAAACGGGTVATTAPAVPTTAATPAAATSPPAGGGGDAVAIVDLAFEPADLTVAAGATVTWTNNGQQPHTVKWSDGEPESDQLDNGDTYQRTFDAAGTFDYICGIHPAMTGSVTVE